MKRLFLTLLLLLPLSACGRVEGWYAVHQYVSHLEQKDYAAAYAMLSTDAQRVTPLSLFENAHRMPEAIREMADASGVEYHILKVEMTGDAEGMAELEVIRPDLQAAMGQKVNGLVDSLFGKKQDEAVKAAPIPTVSEVARLKLVKEDAGWRIEPQGY